MTSKRQFSGEFPGRSFVSLGTLGPNDDGEDHDDDDDGDENCFHDGNQEL